MPIGCARTFCGTTRNRSQTPIRRCDVVTGRTRDSAARSPVALFHALEGKSEEIYNVAWRSLGLRSR